MKPFADVIVLGKQGTIILQGKYLQLSKILDYVLQFKHMKKPTALRLLFIAM